MVSPEVYYHAIQRVNELLELREGFYDHINDSYDKHHRWKELARVALQLQTLSLQVG